MPEWFYTGNTIDLEAPEAQCELCDHPDIRYQFIIQNEYTGNELLIGSECITKFDIRAVDEWGDRMGTFDTAEVVRRDRNKLITEAKRKRLINAMVALARVDEQFNIDSLLVYFEKRGAFTPKQLGLVLWRLETHGIEHTKSDFKVTIKRDREKQQLKNLEEWQAEKIWPCLTTSQREWYNSHKKTR